MRKNKVQHKQSFIQGLKKRRALYLLLLPSFIIFFYLRITQCAGLLLHLKTFRQPRGFLAVHG